MRVGIRFCLFFPGLVAALHCAAAELPPPGVPAAGTKTLTIVAPAVLEIYAVVAGSPKVPPDGPIPPAEVPKLVAGDFTVTADGTNIAVREVGFRRRVAYAPLKQRDLRIGNSIYLQLETPLREQQTVTVNYRGSVPWLAPAQLTAKMEPTRLGPALHVNQAGYAPALPKSAMVGYYLGTLGELEVGAASGPGGAGPKAAPPEFTIVDARSGNVALKGTLKPRLERNSPQPWYRRVLEADFSELRTPGEYRLVVPGCGASYPFLIDDGIPAALARTFALGFYHQRCGAANQLPFTRFVHEACHTAPVEVPTRPVKSLPGFDEAAPNADLYPFVRKGKFDASGGHHDAGDYSKYTTNSAALIHTLMFAVDTLAGVAALDNLGLPESGDGVSDVLQIAKWESDFLVKLQDEDGGFYFLVYPRDRRYEGDVLPDHGDPQIVWPKNSAATAAAVAALAQCASSPAFRKQWPDVAKRYLDAAQRGWKFITDAEAKHGAGHTYRKFTHYGDLFEDADEIAWALCELYLATGDLQFDKELRARFNPRDQKTRHYTWRRMTEGYGNAIRSYAFGARSGRVQPKDLDRAMLKQCEDEIIACAEDWLKASNDCAYGVSYPEPMKRVLGGGWYFSSHNAFDLAVAAQLEFPPKADRRPAYREAVLENFNYDTGCNPINVSYVTGLGWRRPIEIVHQYAQNDRRVLPPSGIILGSIQVGFSWFGLYKSELGAQSFPLDDAKAGAAYPILDRWGDAFNLQTEFVVPEQARALATAAWLMAQSPLRDQPWKAAAGEITGVPAGAPAKLNQPLTLRLKAAGKDAAKDAPLDLAPARIVWEGRENPPVFGAEFTFTPKQAGEQWVEAEAQLPDGRRVFGVATFSAK